VAAMMAIAGGAHAAKVCVSTAQFESIYNSAILSKNTYYCSDSPDSHKKSGNYCWCFASGSWSYSSGNFYDGDCHTRCPKWCDV
jgi:hypothetical protein